MNHSLWLTPLYENIFTPPPPPRHTHTLFNFFECPYAAFVNGGGGVGFILKRAIVGEQPFYLFVIKWCMLPGTIRNLNVHMLHPFKKWFLPCLPVSGNLYLVFFHSSLFNSFQWPHLVLSDLKPKISAH